MTIPPEAFLVHSLQNQPWGLKAARILSASLAAADPGKALAELLRVSQNQLQVGAEVVDLDGLRRLFLLAVGKAAPAMALQAGQSLGRTPDGVFVLSKSLPAGPSGALPTTYQLFTGGHPLPDQSSLSATQAILQKLTRLTDRDLVLVLLSGGGSALLCLPAGDLSLADLQQTNQALLDCGAAIQEVNVLRKHLSRVKGGQLAAWLQPARTISLILSDVIGDPVDLIASGPTAPDSSTFSDAHAIVRKYSLESKLPGPVLEHLSRGVQGLIPETPKPGDRIFDRASHLIIASNQGAARGAVDQAAREGLQASLLPDPILGEASQAGAALAGLLVRNKAQGRQAACTVGGGETTVTLPGSPPPGLGGRNLELALSAVKALSGIPDVCLVTLATDGEDGVTDAAGAVVTGESLARARELGLDPDDFLLRHDAYHFFEPLGDLIVTGQTGTNVSDLCFLFNW